MTIAQAVPAAPLLEQTSSLDPRHGVGQDAGAETDDLDEQRGVATIWLKENQLMLTYFVAGGLAGAASRTVVSPLERLKIIL
ncbi:hypothetical protein QFC22_002542 [Naganishia vaughanmartiniae]|uniref:Uncharacterized protein n=1 Tax=Naganishia vaughanmartiniae TaxID=1424756 RepID=A0ACC2X9Y7_9TREE|nr:hypothetical protein QFC22_002542 [Naganishia vaughanmartiniae]